MAPENTILNTRHASPSFSIIIPTYNRPRQLAVCLRALVDLEHPGDCFEVIVVDDGGAISLEPVVAPFRDRINLKLLKRTNAGPAAARNTGAEYAQGDFLVFTDDDCTPAANWLRVFAKYLKKSPECIVGGRTINRLTHNIFSTTSQLVVDIVYRHYNTDPRCACFFTSNNIAAPAHKFRDLGGFNSSFRFSEDRELCDRWRHHGNRMIYAEDAILYHAHSLDPRTFFRQHFEYGRGACRYHKIRARRGSGTMHGEIKFHLSPGKWLLFPFERFHWKKSIPLAGALLLWEVINAIGFFYEKIAEKNGLQ